MRLCPLAYSVVCELGTVEKSATTVDTVKVVQFRVPKYSQVY